MWRSDSLCGEVMRKPNLNGDIFPESKFISWGIDTCYFNTNDSSFPIYHLTSEETDEFLKHLKELVDRRKNNE